MPSRVLAVSATCPDMAPVCRMLELFRAKEKPEEEKVVKKEDGPSTPSPAKRMATDMEKKLKNMPGDVSLVKVGIYLQKG